VAELPMQPGIGHLTTGKPDQPGVAKIFWQSSIGHLCSGKPDQLA